MSFHFANAPANEETGHLDALAACDISSNYCYCLIMQFYVRENKKKRSYFIWSVITTIDVKKKSPVYQ